MVRVGDILHIDLSLNTCFRSSYPRRDSDRFLYGRGYNSAYLFRHLAQSIDPLGSDNILIISCGLLTGTAAPASSRVHLSALSPQTGLLGSSNVGGYFGASLRAAGVQSLVITGRARRSSLLWIHDGETEILDADALWGLTTWDAEAAIREKLHPTGVSSLVIGPAGERGTVFACVMADREHAAGRTGIGAVMGAKLLKAIVVQRPRRFSGTPSNQERTVIERYIRMTKQSPEFEMFSRNGGAGYIKWADEQGFLATRNYQSNHFEGAQSIDASNLARYKKRSTGCYRCPVQCKAELQLGDGGPWDKSSIRPEFESMAALGARCGLSTIKDVVFLDNLCSRLGIDTISAGGAISFAMDLCERGILSERDTQGLDLRWGNAEAMETLIVQMALGEGFGAIFSQGLRKAAEAIGREAIRYAPHVKNLDLSAYHPSYLHGTALGYAISARGGDFNQVYPSIEYASPVEKKAGKPTDQGKSEMIKRAMLICIALDCLGLCKIPSLSLIRTFDLSIESELAAILTGNGITPEALFSMAGSVADLERLFNLRQGATAADDQLPEVFLEKPGESGGPGATANWLQPLVRDFYRAMGWDDRGVPARERCEQFEIDQSLQTVDGFPPREIQRR